VSVVETAYIAGLWLGTALFLLRVLGQLYVALYRPPFLPPMQAWYSGLLPYPLLLPSQILFLMFMAIVATDFTERSGQFYVTSPTTGRALTVSGSIYFGSMLVRYLIRMARHPEARWLGGTIPILLHCVLASFVLLTGTFRVIAR
jgi:hypothetical protein